MKSLPTVFLTIFLLILSGCHQRNAIDETYPWPSSGNAAVDSLLMIFEKKSASGSHAKSLRGIVDTLYMLSEKNSGNRLLLSRAMFCDASTLSIWKDSLRIERLRNTALTMLDSTTHPYDYNRWKILKRIETSLDNFIQLTNGLSYFQKINDRLQCAHCYRHLGSIMLGIGNTKRAYSYIEKSRELFLQLGDSINALAQLGDLSLTCGKEKHDSIMRLLLATEAFTSRYNYKIVALNNYYNTTDSIPLIDEAIALCRKNKEDSILFMPMLYARKGHHHARKVSKQEGLALVEKAMQMMPEGYRNDFKEKVYEAYADANIRVGNYKKAAFAYDIRDSLKRLNGERLQNSMITDADLQSEITVYEERIKKDNERALLLLIVACLVIAVLGVCVLYISARRSKRKKCEALRTEMKYQESRQNLVATSMVLEEKEQFIRQLMDEISAMSATDNISDQQKGRLLQIVKTHMRHNEERQQLMRIQQHSGGEFIRRLKAEYPGLTESQLQLASMISAGIDTGQISRFFNIDRLSVNKSRYRLRLKLGLRKDEGLDDFLRRFGRDNNE